uniref:Prefoldin subunit 3 n=1 Tax=Compsopogon caeruleus TaxID=31354 RepID=A0A7S1TCK1_9RHOD|mmetsp:Transcript_16667/g.34237  ORF Transcript_16667/g.34237 Transcript_16667/m.34237 type:complete len:184 (+) Transcript_16667:104-655(+)
MSEPRFAKAPSEEHRGIPVAVFLEDIPAAVAKYGVQDSLSELTLLLQKYKFWEGRLGSQRKALAMKIPSTEQSLEVIDLLEGRAAKEESIETTFEISDQLFARARVEDCHRVFVWLGANVMVDMSTAEAASLLRESLQEAKASLDAHNADLQFVRDQMNVTEVNMTRIFNHDIIEKRKGMGQG